MLLIAISPVTNSFDLILLSLGTAVVLWIHALYGGWRVFKRIGSSTAYRLRIGLLLGVTVLMLMGFHIGSLH